MTARQSVVIVGAGLSGLRTGQHLRTAGFDGALTIIGDELHFPYNRPPLSKNALLQEIPPSEIEFRRKPELEGIDWRLGDPVVASHLTGRTLQLASGEEVHYDALVAATGSRPRRLLFDLEPTSRHVIRTIDEAVALRRSLRRGGDLVILGSGFVSCEIATIARTLGCNVDVVTTSMSPLSRLLGERVGRALQHRLEDIGVRFHLGRTVVDAAPASAESILMTLDDGTTLRAGSLVEAVGSTPNVDWLRGNDLDLSDGVLSDGFLRPLVSGFPVDRVVVAGDIARFPSALFDEVPRRFEHWNFAADSARFAARVLAAQLRESSESTAEELSGLRRFTPLPSFWSDQAGVRLQAFGYPAEAEDCELLEGDLDDEFAMGYLIGGELVGVALLGLVNRQPHYRAHVLAGLSRRALVVT